jgi:xyloglucan fucosyltransferase
MARAQEWIDKHFPTREMFAPLAAFLLRIAPQYEAKIAAFRQARFGAFTIGLQIRRRKCSGDEAELACALRPSIERFCQVARSIQYAHGLGDEDVRFLLAADEPATYTKVNRGALTLHPRP